MDIRGQRAEFGLSTWILDGCVWTRGKAENHVGKAEQSVHMVLCLLASN